MEQKTNEDFLAEAVAELELRLSYAKDDASDNSRRDEQLLDSYTDLLQAARVQNPTAHILPHPNVDESNRFPVPSKSYVIWNNKGGVGKSTLTFNVACEYARQFPLRRVLVLDMCPQGNVSHSLLGGGSKGPSVARKLAMNRQDGIIRTVCGYVEFGACPLPCSFSSVDSVDILRMNWTVLRIVQRQII